LEGAEGLELKQQQYGDSLATTLILDELFDLSYYQTIGFDAANKCAHHYEKNEKH
jgi:hypothetical protein